MNQCIHGIDLLRWMLGDEIEEVYGATRQQFHDYLEAEDIGMAVVKCKNGAIATIEERPTYTPKPGGNPLSLWRRAPASWAELQPTTLTFGVC